MARFQAASSSPRYASPWLPPTWAARQPPARSCCVDPSPDGLALFRAQQLIAALQDGALRARVEQVAQRGPDRGGIERGDALHELRAWRWRTRTQVLRQ